MTVNKPSKRQLCLTIAVCCLILTVAYELFIDKLVAAAISDSTVRSLVDMSVTRFLGGVIFVAINVNLGYGILDPIKRPFWRSVLICLPALAVAVNNFPFSQIISGGAVIDSAWWKIALLAFQCFSVGFFEETAFRGAVLFSILKRRKLSRAWMFWSVMLSSAVFGLVHLINLYQSSPLSVIMQIGYSFLIGAMCSVVVLKTSNIWLCVILHGTFNFCGALVPTCGYGEIWDTFTVVITVVIAVITAIYMFFVFWRLDPDRIEKTLQG